MSSTSSSSDDHVEQSHNLELEGKILGNYNVLIELGRGAYSIVWLVYNIEDNNFYAMKVQNPDDFKDGLKEINFLKKLPEKCQYLNHLKHYFLERVNGKKYLCSLYELQCGKLD
jgi:serine/threonine protein kinase